MSLHNVGSIRPSQLLWTYGPGALIDLPNLSVITMGLDRWETERCAPVDEARLLAAVRRVIGSQVQRLRMPPVNREDNPDPMSTEAKIGVPVRPFPRYLRCIKCGLLAEYDSGLFDIEPNPYRPELTHFVHTNCPKGRKVDAVPARFLMACRNGHLDDFPWHWFVHDGPSECKGSLYFFEDGASLQTENLIVKCDGCSTVKNMARAFGKAGAENLPACRGRHPHLNKWDECDTQTRAVLLGATNSWFPVTLSVLAIPMQKNQLDQLIHDGWEYFRDAESAMEVKAIVKTLSKSGSLPGIDKYSPDDIWRIIEEKRGGGTEFESTFDIDIKTPEWQVLTSDKPPVDWPHFLANEAKVPRALQGLIDRVSLLERLREVNALVGYTRVEAPEESTDPDERPPMAPLARIAPDWVPVNEVHGEGIFIQFNDSVISKWEAIPAVKERSIRLETGHRGWRNARKLDPEKGFPGIRYVLLHTFAHALIRELALECGYNAASIRERIYSGENMAGVLLYTAAADSDGTLGGLVELGKPENLGRLVSQALERALVCSSDPLCSEHNPAVDRSLHAASCHACTFVAETSCERGNRYLDRALLVKTFAADGAEFFSEELYHG